VLRVDERFAIRRVCVVAVTLRSVATSAVFPVAPERGDHGLLRSAVNTPVLNDLDIAARARLLDAEKHRDPK